MGNKDPHIHFKNKTKQNMYGVHRAHIVHTEEDTSTRALNIWSSSMPHFTHCVNISRAAKTKTALIVCNEEKNFLVNLN